MDSEAYQRLVSELNKTNDGWDWPWLWFAGTYIFKIPEERFWRMTPRQLSTYSEQYVMYKEKTNPGKDRAKAQKHPGTMQAPQGAAFIDNLF